MTRIAQLFVQGRISADLFAESYISAWKKERDSGQMAYIRPDVSEALSTIFCLADLYNPAMDREGYELDEEQLRSKVKELLKLILAISE